MLDSPREDPASQPSTASAGRRRERFVLLFGWLVLALFEVGVGTGLPFGISLAGAAAVVLAFAALGGSHEALAPRLPSLPVHPATPALVYAASAFFLYWTRHVRRQESIEGAVALGLVFVAACVLARIVIRLLARPHPRPQVLGLVAGVAGAVAVVCHQGLEIYLKPGGSLRDTLAATGPLLLLGIVVSAALGVARSRKPRLVCAGCAALALLLAAPGLPSSPASSRQTSVVLITVDTLRADDATHMQSYRRLAERGEAFTDALSAASWTLPAMASTMTGVYPHRHGAAREGLKWVGAQRIASDFPTLAQRFREAGYVTAAFATSSWLVRGLGFAEGFDHWDHPEALVSVAPLALEIAGRRGDLAPVDPVPTDARGRVDLALQWLDRRPAGPFFLWLHLLDPHLPYWHSEFPEGNELNEVYGEKGGAGIGSPLIVGGKFRPAPGTDEALRSAYRFEVAGTDREIGRFLDGLEARGLLEDLVLAFASDHGEEFWEHGEFGHGHAMVPEVLHIPLVVVRPSGPAGALRSDPASLVDIAPTLLAAAGLSASQDLDGLDLAAGVPADRVRFAENTIYYEERRAVVQGSWVLDQSFRGSALYDDASDPEWRRDLSQSRSGVVARLEAHLEEAGEVRPGELGDFDREALEVLGYLGR